MCVLREIIRKYMKTSWLITQKYFYPVLSCTINSKSAYSWPLWFPVFIYDQYCIYRKEIITWKLSHGHSIRHPFPYVKFVIGSHCHFFAMLLRVYLSSQVCYLNEFLATFVRTIVLHALINSFFWASKFKTIFFQSKGFI